MGCSDAAGKTLEARTSQTAAKGTHLLNLLRQDNFDGGIYTKRLRDNSYHLPGWPFQGLLVLIGVSCG